MSIPQRFLKSGLSLSKITKRSFATYKTSTGLVGLAVAINGREDLLKLSSDVLESVKKIPDGTAYRGNVEKWFNFITKSCTDTHDIREIETEIGLGQIEEVMEMAKSELKLVDYYFGKNQVYISPTYILICIYVTVNLPSYY
jgi:hypothetical protein